MKKKLNVKDLVNKYTYRVSWSEDDSEFVATCLEFPSLSALAKSPEKALKEIRDVVAGSVEWMDEEKETLPEPISSHKYKGNLTLRTTPEKHKVLAVKAAESGVSINQYILSIV